MPFMNREFDYASELAELDRADAETLVRQAMAAVTRLIKARSLVVGDTLPGLQFFVDELNVSRPVMREAFGALAALGLIDIGNGRRPRVCAIDPSVMASSLDHAVSTAQVTVPQVWDVRRALEIRTAAIAAELRTQAEAEEISFLAARISAAPSGDARVSADIAFHQAIARATHNPLFVQIIGSFEPLMQIATPAAWGTRQTTIQRKAIFQVHEDIAHSIFDRDPISAAFGMEQHFDASIRDLLAGAAHVEREPDL